MIQKPEDKRALINNQSSRNWETIVFGKKKLSPCFWGRIFLYFFAVMGILGLSLFAEEKEKVLVEASRPAGGEKSDLSSFSTIFYLQNPLATLSEILSRTEGVQIRLFGGPGSLSTLSIRGSSSQQVSVFLDGFPLSTAQNSTIDLSQIPLSALSRIEVIRGGDSGRFGSGSMGGSLHLFTKDPGKKSRKNLSMTYGSFNTAQIQYSQLGKILEDLKYLLSLDLFFTDGNFTYATEGVKIGGVTLGKGEKEGRQNNRNLHGEGLFKVDKKFNSHLNGSFLQEIFISSKGIPGLEFSPLLEAHQEDLRSLTAIKFQWETENWTVIPRFFFRVNTLGFSDPHPSLGPAIFSHDKNFSYGGEGIGKRFLSHSGLEHNLMASFLIREDRLNSNQLSDSNRETLRFYGQDEITLLDEKIALAPSVAYEWASDFGGEWSAKLGARGLIPLGKNHTLSLQANLRRVFRFPQFNELYYPNLGFVRGNADLRAEKGWGGDGGIQWKGKIFSCRGVYFWREMENSIIWVNLSPTTIGPINTGRVRSRGVEASFSLGPIYFTSLKTSYTFLETLWQTTGRELPGKAKHSLKSRVEFSKNPFRLFGEVQYSSGVFTNLGSTIFLREYFQVDAGLTWRFSKEGRISLSIKNILDAPLRDVRGFPQPGRSLFVKVSFQF